MAAKLFTPQLIRRGLEIFLLISLAGFAFTFVYGKNPQAVLDKVLHLHWAWLLVGHPARLDGLDRRRAAALGGRPAWCIPIRRSAG